MRFRDIENPIRRFILVEDDLGGLRTFWPEDAEAARFRPRDEDPTLLPDLCDRLRAYFRGGTWDFSDVPTPTDGTFRQRCWEACRAIPPGEVRSYRQLAELAGSDVGASRAAGQAMRHNPLPIIIPCHRVVSSTGTLHGFAGSSDPRGEMIGLKQRLLDLEGYRPSDGQPGLFDADPRELSSSSPQSD